MVTTTKPKTKKSSSGMDIPDWAFETLARCLLPRMQQYYESEVGKKDLETYRAERDIMALAKTKGVRHKTEPS